MLSSLRGLTVRGPMVGRDHAYVLVKDWLEPSAPIDRDRARAELARRYLAGHGPSGERDLAKWAGVTLGEARAGLGAIASELHMREDGLVDLVKRPPAAELPPPRLLGAFDPLLHGWTSREAVLGSHQGIVTVNGLFRPFALVRGRAVATWNLSAGKISLKPFGRLGSREKRALDREAEDVLRYLAPAP
jgi:hypothetical protein